MTVDEMERLLDELGIEHVGANGSEIQGFCPGHIDRTGHADKNPSWYINAETGAHICFSCEFKGGVNFLVAYKKGFYTETGSYDFDQVEEYLKTGGDLSEAFERAVSKKAETFEELVYVSEASLSAFTTPPLEALKSRGLTPQAADEYELLWDTRRNLWVIPIRDLDTGNLLGWQEKGYQDRYFRNQPNGIKKSRALFGYQTYTGGDMIVVESPLDVIRLASIGLTGGVATYGSMVSEHQLKFIKRADRIIFAMDADEAGVLSAHKLLKASKDMGFECWFFNYSDTTMKDVGGMSKSEVLTGLELSRHSVRYGLKDSV